MTLKKILKGCKHCARNHEERCFFEDAKDKLPARRKASVKMLNEIEESKCVGEVRSENPSDVNLLKKMKRVKPSQ